MNATESSVQVDTLSQWIVVNDDMIKTLDTRLKLERVMIG